MKSILLVKNRVDKFVYLKLRALALLVLASLVSLTAEAKTTLYIFNPSYTKAHVLQKQIESVCPDLEVTVYAKAKDLRLQMKKNASDSVISLMTVLDQYKDYKPFMKGKGDKGFVEDYFLVSLGDAIKMENLDGKKVGVVDLLGRKPMKKFVTDLLGNVSIKRVAKVEDLLPLLTFKSADLLFMSESDLKDLKKITQLDLHVQPTSVQMALSVAAYMKPEDKETVSACIKKFDENLNDYFDVVEWRLSE